MLFVGTSYAIWQLILQQESSNVVNTACFKISFKDQNEINLQSAYPISDEEGMKLAPYTFTIENICNTTAFYQINLEELETSLKKLSNEYVKVSLNNSNGKILNTYTEVDKTLENATSSHRLTSGSLKEEEKKTYELRLWLDENTPATSDVMNATFQSKITIIAIQKEGLENEFTEENKSLNEDFSNKEETIEFKAVSKDYNIIEKSEDNIIYNPLDEPRKEVAIFKTYTIDGTYSMYFKDEVGNIIESTAETTKLDQVAPIVNFTASEYQDGIKVDASSSSDEKSGIKNYYYKLNKNEYVESSSSSHTFAGLSDGDYKVTVRVEDYAGNVSAEKELDITIAYEKVYVSSSGNDSSGNGSLAKPYATLQRAYNKVKSGGEILLLSDIRVTSTTNMNIANKTVTLKSNGANQYNVTKSGSLTTSILNITNSNTVTTMNIIFDGNEVVSSVALIEAYNTTLNLNSGTIVQRNINRGRFYAEWNGFGALGGGLYIYSSTLNINNAVIKDNVTNPSSGLWSSGGGIILYFSNLYFNSGKIINNSATRVSSTTSCGGGGISSTDGTVSMAGGLISENHSASTGGGIFINDITKNSNMYLRGGSIINNSATEIGGGIHAFHQGTNTNITVYLVSGTVQNNTAPVGSNIYALKDVQIIDQR